MNDIKLMTDFKFIRDLVSALRESVSFLQRPTYSYATAISAVLLCCSWYSAAMAQTGEESSAPQVRVRLFLEAPLGRAAMAPLAVRVATDGPILQLARRGDEVTVQVIIDAVDTTADLMMTFSTDESGAEVVAVPSAPIIVAASGMMQRIAQFALTAKKAGAAIVFITVTDDEDNKATTSLRIEVAEGGDPPQPSLSVIEPQANTELRLLSDEPEATTQVEVVIESLDSASTLTMTLFTDAAEVVAVPSTPIIVAAGDALRRSASFEITAKKAGVAVVTIAVTDGVSTATVALRVIVEQLPHTIAVIEPQADTELVWRLLSRGVEATTQVEVVIDASDTTADIRMTISTDAAGAEVVVIPSEPIVIAADGTAMRRSAEFELTAKTISMATVTIAVTDGASTATVALRVIVEELPHTIDVIEPQANTELRLLSRGADATTQVQVMIDASDTAADLRMTVSTDGAGAEVVAIPSELIIVAADGDAMRRSTEFELTAKEAGMVVVRIAVTDGASTDTVALRVIVIELPHTIAVIEPQPNTELQLMSRGDEATTQVQVMIDASDTAAELRMTISTDAAGAEVVAIPSEPIIVAADGTATQRSAQFELTAKEAGMAVVRIAVTDGASTDTVALRVIIIELPHTLAVIEPQTDTELRLLSRGVEAMAQVQVMIDASDTAAELRMTISTDAAGAEVVAIPSEPIIVAADGTATQRSAQFELTAKEAGMAVVRIAVTDGASTATVALRIVVAEPTLEILSPSDGTQIALARGDGSLAATQVEVVIVQKNVEVPITLDLQLERIAGSPVFISTTSLTLTASADGSTRTRFTLAAAEMGNTTLTLVASDSLGNRAVVSVYVSVERLNKLCESCLVPDMRTVSAGTFKMGSPANRPDRRFDESDEEPQQQVNISYAFAVGQYELTRGQYRAFVDASGHAAGNAWLNPGITQNDAHPVVGVPWNDTNDVYLSWLSEQTGEEWRLLSEAEWEYAARAGTTTSYSFGDTIDATQARFSSTGTVAVGSYAANEFGLYDMHGNVREWVEDCYHHDYNGAPMDGSARVKDCRDMNRRVLRGGSWGSDPRKLRSAFRDWNHARNRGINNGFRVARTLKP